jgi:hypothetical protein
MSNSENLDPCNKTLMLTQIELQRQKSQTQIIKEKLLYSINKIKILNKRLKRFTNNNANINTEYFTNVNNKKSSNHILIIFFIIFILFIYIKFKKKLIK